MLSLQDQKVHEMYVKVRIFVFDQPSVVEVYDTNNDGDCEAWDKNQELYPCQVVSYAEEREDAFNGVSDIPCPDWKSRKHVLVCC